MRSYSVLYSLKKKAVLIDLEQWETFGKIFMMSWSLSPEKMNPLFLGAN